MAKQKELADKVVEVASTFSEVFEEVSGILAKLDVLAGFADIAACAPIEYARPQIRPMEDGNIEIFNGRHPCVEVQDNVSFIPNDTQLLKGASYFHIITGPNMGGRENIMRSCFSSSTRSVDFKPVSSYSVLRKKHIYPTAWRHRIHGTSGELCAGRLCYHQHP